MQPSITVTRLAFVAVTIGLCQASSLASQNDSERIRKALDAVDPCIIDSVFSFFFARSYPPTNAAQMREACRIKLDGYKCIKTNTKTAPALIKRGLATLVATQQRLMKKMCANQTGEAARKFTAAGKCLMEKKFDTYHNIDKTYADGILAIRDSKFNSTTEQINHICCKTYIWHKDWIDSYKPECSAHAEQVEALLRSMLPDDITLLCDDSDKMLKNVCPQLAVLKASAVDSTAPGAPSMPSTILRLVTTLGTSE